MNVKAKSKGFVGMLAILLAGMMVTMLNQSIINVALPQIMNQFKIDASTAQWLATGFMLVSGILVPISAYLVQKFSYRQLFITAMASFSIGSLVCAMSGNFEVMMIGRVLQAVGGGILMPLSLNIFMAAFPPEKRGSAMGFLGLGMILAPAIGPTVGGYVIENHSWHILFAAMAVIGAVVLIVSLFFFTFQSEKGSAKLDVKGVILSTIGFGSLLYGVSNISSKGWDSPHVYAFLITAVIALTIFVFYAIRKKNPLLEMRVFKNFNFTYTLIVNIILQIALFGGMLLLPIYLQQIRGFTPLEAGLLLLPGSLLMGVIGIVTGKLFDKVGIRILAIIGMSIMTIVTYFLSKLSMETSYTTIMILYTIRSIGMAFVMMPITTAGLATISPALIAHANALSSTLRQVAASVGTAILVVVMTNQAKSYMMDLGTNVKPDSLALATVHGIDVAFLVATFISAAALVMSFFFKKPKPVVYDVANDSAQKKIL